MADSRCRIPDSGWQPAKSRNQNRQSGTRKLESSICWDLATGNEPLESGIRNPASGIQHRKVLEVARKIHVTTTVNGEQAEFLCEPRQSLLEVLRDELRLTGARKAATTATAARATSCWTAGSSTLAWCWASRPKGQTLETIEGLAKHGHLHPLQQRFLENAALQCGICTPGFIVAAKALLDQQPESRRARDPLLAGRQPVPLHRLRQDHPRRAGRRRGNCRRNERYAQQPLTILESACQRHRPWRSTDELYLGKKEYQVIGTRPSATTASTRSPAGRSTAPTCSCRPAARPDPAQPARPRAHPVDRHQQGAGAAGRRGGRHRGRLPGPDNKIAETGRGGAVNLGHLSSNCLARDKVLYRGHAVAAVAAVNAHIAEEALQADRGRVRAAAAASPDVLRRHERRRAAAARRPAHRLAGQDRPTSRRNIAKHLQFKQGDVAAGLRRGRRRRRARVPHGHASTRATSSRTTPPRCGTPTAR